MDTFQQLASNRLANIGGQSVSTYSESLEIDEGRPKPTRSHHACIAELVLRFPCPRDLDPDAYEARAKLLARDCAHIAPALLRKACDRAAQSARGLPYASEILQHAAAIVEERQRAEPAPACSSWGDRPFPRGEFAPQSIEHRRWIAEVNLYQAHHNAPSRLVLPDDATQSVMVMLVDGYRCNSDGTVTDLRA